MLVVVFIKASAHKFGVFSDRNSDFIELRCVATTNWLFPTASNITLQVYKYFTSYSDRKMSFYGTSDDFIYAVIFRHYA